jgi:hypothetical protein
MDFICNIHLQTSTMSMTTATRHTAQKNIAKTQKSEQPSTTSSRRSKKRPYEYPSHCLICAEELDFENALRHPNPQTDINSVEVINKDKKSLLQDKLLAVCDKRQGSIAINVKSRILFAGDIRPVEAKYHRGCMQKFMSDQIGTRAESPSDFNIRNLDVLNDEAFKQVCEWLVKPEQQKYQFSQTDLRAYMSGYLPQVPAYSTKHIKRRLLEHFGDQITISEVDGKSNVVTLKDTAASILCESYVETVHDGEQEATNKLTKEVASRIKQDILDIDH